jgi:hypothetical protein
VLLCDDLLSALTLADSVTYNNSRASLNMVMTTMEVTNKVRGDRKPTQHARGTDPANV